MIGWPSQSRTHLSSWASVSRTRNHFAAIGLLGHHAEVAVVCGSYFLCLVLVGCPTLEAPLASVVLIHVYALSKPVQPHQKPSQKISGFHYWYNVVGKKPFEGLRCTPSKVATLVFKMV